MLANKNVDGSIRDTSAIPATPAASRVGSWRSLEAVLEEIVQTASEKR